MSTPNHNLDDIFPEKPLPPEAETEQPSSLSDQITRELHKRRIINICFGIVIGCILMLVVGTVVYTYVSRPAPAPKPIMVKEPYVPSYALPPQENWVLQYRQALNPQLNQEVQADGPQTTQWIKYVAYHVIMGEQALRADNLELARTYLEKALETFPDMRGIHGSLGEVYLKQKNFEKAAEHLEAALKEHVSVDLVNNLGIAYMGLKQFEQAEKYLQQALQMDPELAGCHKNLALLYQQMGRDEEALHHFKLYFETYPDDAESLGIYIHYLTDLNRHKKAITFLEGLASTNSLPVQLLLAETAAQLDDVEKTVTALKNAARFLGPEELLAEMHREVFDVVKNERVFEDFAFQLELAAVSLSTNLPTLNLENQNDL